MRQPLGAEQKSLLYEVIFAYSLDEKDEADKRLSEKNFWPKFDTLLQNITVVDPACGSGSFLVGMLQVLDDLVQRADKVLGRQETPYERRKRIIGQSLYGVDVMRWAVEVAELRLWLQLVIETELEPAELKFRPLLPNLTFKVRRGDSLFQEFGGINMAHLKSTCAVSPALKGRLTRLKGEKLKYFNNDRSSKFSSASEIQLEEFKLFRDILEARAHELSNQLKRTRSNLADTTTNLFGDTVGVVLEAQRHMSEAEAATFQAELDQTTTALDALRRVKDTPFVWDIAFVEIFDGERRGFDIVIGNPPYVRQENISNPLVARDEVTAVNKKEYKNKLIRSVYMAYPDFFGANPEKPTYKLNAKSDLYIYFFFQGLSLLNEKGSFCFITSNSWLDVGYGKDLQVFLLAHSHVRMVLDNKAKRSFASADVNTAIALLAPPVMRSGKAEEKTARFVMFTLPFEQILSPIIFDEIETATERKTTPEYRLFPIDQTNLFEDGCDMPEEEEDRKTSGRGGKNKAHGPHIKVTRYIGNKWGGKYLRAPDIYWTILQKGKGKLVRLGNIAEVRRGFTTGANEFFYLNEERIREWGIEEEFLKPVIISPRECSSIKVIPSELKRRAFVCHEKKQNIPGTAAYQYIQWGEQKEFHNRPSCCSRPRWYEFPEKEWAHVLWPMIHNDRQSVFWNPYGVAVDHNLFEILGFDDDLLWGSLAWTAQVMFRELHGRANLGQGALKTEGIDIRTFALLCVRDDSIVEGIRSMRKKLSQRAIGNVKEESKRQDKIELDNIFFDILGLSRAERDAVYEAVIDLVEARLNKADSLKPKRK